MSTQAFETREENWRVVGLRTEAAEVAIVPELGAKIIRLQDRRTGRQWMWRSGRSPELFRVAGGTTFGDGPVLGGDECIPTIEPCTWRGRSLPDHGEVWTEAWSLDEAALERGALVTRVGMAVSPLKLERGLRLEDATVRLTYALTNLSDEPQEYLWAFHGMMNIEPGDRIVLPEDCHRFRTEAVMGACPLGARGDQWDWPMPRAGIDLSRMDLGGDGRAVKLYTEPVSRGRVEIRNESGRGGLAYTFDPEALDTIGIWLNRGAWGGFQHVAIEPSNGAPDALTAAVRDWHRYATVPENQRSVWGLDLQLLA